MNRLSFVLVFIAIFLVLDIYAYQLVRSAIESYSNTVARIVTIAYWLSSAILVFGLIFFTTNAYGPSPIWLKTFFQGFLIVALIPKLVLAVFALVDDVIRGGRWLADLITPESAAPTEPNESKGISRSQFIAHAGIMVASVPALGASWGILSGAHDYRIRRRELVFKNLPKAFDGMKIVQLSDIHSGSFWNKTAVVGGIEMAMAEKPDVIFFTGDLVNNVAKEMGEYQNVFDKLKAPMGVFSVLGNHDYGDYVQWPSAQAKQQNLRDLISIEKNMGWQLLMDENVKLKVDNEELAIVGIQNWGAKGRFPKYGNLSKALVGTDDVPVKLLLSHDPSHWRAEVIPDFKQVDAMFAGHTHGAQCGVELGNYRWSPVKMMYEEWADLYKENDQYLYVNRGFGYIGFPGRFGILPEITVFELRST